MKFIDLFSGCGGLSLGLVQAGWDGVFAVEKNPDAFSTFKHNLVEGHNYSFSWPEWLPKTAHSTSDLLNTYSKQLRSLRGSIDLIAGGPPCQGFSFAGRRNPNDPRNQLFEEYLKIVKLVQPKMLIFENVKGFTAAFKNKKKEAETPHSSLVENELDKMKYKVFSNIIFSSDYGVPQPRRRFILIAIKKNWAPFRKNKKMDPIEMFEELALPFKESKGLSKAPTSVQMAIGDLEIKNKKLVECTDCNQKGFKQIDYLEPNKLSAYQKIMRNNAQGCAPNSLRIPRHQDRTVAKFKQILKECPKGKNLSDADRERLGMRKHTLHPLHPDKVSATVTTLPDDIIHYSEPRILTVRETARLQSFPDWFAFQGKYTTGGDRRKFECPRYTQVGNAVPPLVAEALGNVLANIYELEHTNGRTVLQS